MVVAGAGAADDLAVAVPGTERGRGDVNIITVLQYYIIIRERIKGLAIAVPGTGQRNGSILLLLLRERKRGGRVCNKIAKLPGID